MSGAVRVDAPMDLTAALPSGTSVLEASAGTGKTFTIAGLVTRYVAEGHARIDQVLAVTFGVAATSELRTRVRERLVLVRDALGDPEAARAHHDPVVVHLAGADDAEVALRRGRLVTALADFDSATVATVHEFCQQVLSGLGIAADTDPHVQLVESLSDVVDDVVEDLYLRHATRPGTDRSALTAKQAFSLARVAVDDRHATLLPEPTAVERDSAPDLRRRYAQAVRDELERRTRAARVLGFDDLLVRVRDALADPVSGPVACERLRSRFRVVLVDEFQDTDPVQWDVLRLAFHGHCTLVVIGDPKQAIYAFRGADVRAYLQAADAADHRATLATNWRSDPRLLLGLGAMFRRAALGDPRIVVRPVSAGYTTPLLGPRVDRSPVRIRQLRRDGHEVTKSGGLPVETARRLVATDAATQVARFLAEGLEVTPRGTTTPRPLVARDVAVLVRTQKQADAVREELLAVGVPCVFTGTKSVFGTEAASDWVVLLEGLEQPHRSGPVRRAALTSLMGWTASRVDERGAEGNDELGMMLRDWADVLAEDGVAALFSRISHDQGLAERLLHRTDGERVLTDLRHVAEALHEVALREQLTLPGLLTWLREQVAQAAVDQDQERSRRLDTDAAAVQVGTVHTSKGLEFPVVLVPFGWDVSFGGRNTERFPRAHDETGHRTVHVGGPGSPGYDAALAVEAEDDAGEELRLLYVASTRAISRLVLWWAPTFNTERSPLHRLLWAEDPSQALPLQVAVPPDDEVHDRLQRLGAAGEGLAVEVVSGDPAPKDGGAKGVEPEADLAMSVLDRTLDEAWSRTSYSGLTRAAHEVVAPVQSEPDVRLTDDEGQEAVADPDLEGLVRVAPAPPPSTDPDAQLLDVPSPMADLPGGAAFGTLVHGVLERADLSTGDTLSALVQAAEVEMRWRAEGLTPQVLAEALLPAVTTPWGAVADGRSLADFRSGDLLPELEFELPLAGGDLPRATRPTRLGQLAGLLRDHLPESDPVHRYADMLAGPVLASQPLRGYLTGSLDLVARVGGPASPRYLVVDHKTNRLSEPDQPLTAWHYRRSALDDAVLHAHYPLQAMLYCVALHRFLRWRQPGYDPDVHLGGVVYLFLRGMCGDAVEPRSDGFVPGVWIWQPPSPLVLALSRLLAGDGR